MTTPHAPNPRHYKYYDLVMAGFVTVLLCSNMIGPGKVCSVSVFGWFPLTFGAGNLFFPISYIFGDILTEVYGYARARKVIWAGFGAMLFYVLMSQIVIAMPGVSAQADYQTALETIFGSSWRIVGASILAYWVGDFVNSFVLAKLKLLTRGRWLWTRTIGSTIVGQAADSAIFYPLAFFGQTGWDTDTIWRVVLFNWGLKVAVEVVFTPLTYVVVNWLKRAENEDYYDSQTNFTPFSLKD